MRDTSAGAHRIVPFGPPNRPSKAVPKMHFLLRKEQSHDHAPVLCQDQERALGSDSASSSARATHRYD